MGFSVPCISKLNDSKHPRTSVRESDVDMPIKMRRRKKSGGYDDEDGAAGMTTAHLCRTQFDLQTWLSCAKLPITNKIFFSALYYYVTLGHRSLRPSTFEVGGVHFIPNEYFFL